MKTKKELNALKEEVEALNKKHYTLSEEELAQVSGGNKLISSDDVSQMHCSSFNMKSVYCGNYMPIVCRYCEHLLIEGCNFYCTKDKTPNLFMP